MLNGPIRIAQLAVNDFLQDFISVRKKLSGCWAHWLQLYESLLRSWGHFWRKRERKLGVKKGRKESGKKGKLVGVTVSDFGWLNGGRFLTVEQILARLPAGETRYKLIHPKFRRENWWE